MVNRLMRKMKKYVVLLFKILFVIVVYGFLWVQLKQKMTGIPAFTVTYTSWLPFILFTILFLWVCNVALEAMKWKTLLGYHCRITLAESVRSVLQGVAFGVFTPYRTGEWLGRVLSFESHRKTGIGMGMIGSGMQMAVMGFAGGLFILVQVDYAHIMKWNYGILLIAGMALIILLILITRKWIKHFTQKIWPAIAGFPVRLYIMAIGLTWLRYLVFSSQLAILLIYMTDLPVRDIILTIPVYFFVITFSPSFSFVELGVRISSGLLLFTPDHAYTLEVSMAVTAIWLLNVLVCAAIGSVLVMKYSAVSFLKPDKPVNLRALQAKFHRLVLLKYNRKL